MALPFNTQKDDLWISGVDPLAQRVLHLGVHWLTDWLDWMIWLNVWLSDLTDCLAAWRPSDCDWTKWLYDLTKWLTWLNDCLTWLTNLNDWLNIWFDWMTGLAGSLISLVCWLIDWLEWLTDWPLCPWDQPVNVVVFTKSTVYFNMSGLVSAQTPPNYQYVRFSQHTNSANYQYVRFTQRTQPH